MPRVPEGPGRWAQDDLGWGFDGARRFQVELGLRLTPAQRLDWLEDTVAEMRELCGLAQKGRPISERVARTR